ncbi:MAG TPA: neprosin family prolyl endopeptidase [Candidatus Saccharimonadales bacterium]|nr:neprosin family prolyl endopeptidase [Candidatus Saccharimonadales bacterium]
MKNQNTPQNLGRIAVPGAQRNPVYASAVLSAAQNPGFIHKERYVFFRQHRAITAVSAALLLIIVSAGLVFGLNQISGGKPTADTNTITPASAKKPLATATGSVKKKTSPSKSPQKQPSQPSRQLQQVPEQPIKDPAQAQPYTGSLPNTVPVNSAGAYNFYYAGGRQYATATGATVTLSQAQPVVPEQVNAENHSLMELAVQSADGRQIVEVGWVVDKTMNGDDLPHLFVYHWVDGQTSCYNACGFVQLSSSTVPGQTVQAGVTGSYGINYSAGSWNITYNGAGLGYFPGSLWGGSFTSLGFVQVFGEVAVSVSSTTKCIQMGNALPGTNPGSAKISNFALVGSATPVALSPFATYPSSYSYGFASARGLNLGGPGSC